MRAGYECGGVICDGCLSIVPKKGNIKYFDIHNGGKRLQMFRLVCPICSFKTKAKNYEEIKRAKGK